MPRRFRRRDENSLLKVLMGFAVAAGVARALGRAFQPGTPAARGSPLVLVLVLLAAFLGMGLLLTVLGGIVSVFGGAAGAALLCLAPAAILVLVVSVILQRQTRSQQPASTSRPARTEASPAQQALSAPVAAAAPRPAALRPIDAYREKGARSPADYRTRAASYRRRIQSLIKTRRRGPLAQRMADVLPKLSSWEERVGQLADRVALFENDDLIRRDIKEVPNHVLRLRRQVALEADPDMQCQMERTLAAYEQQHQHLEALARLIRRTRLNLDDTLAAMGTIYSQVQVLNAMDIDGANAAHIAEEVDHEVDRLNDLLSALGEVNGRSATGATVTQGDALDQDTGFAARRSRLERRGPAG